MPSAFSFRTTICGLQELEDHSDSQVTHVVSILDPAHPFPSAFTDYGEHERLELRFHDIIDERPHHHEPKLHHVEQILDFGRTVVNTRHDAPNDNRHLLVHCHAGISRSTAAMTLILALGHPEMAAPDLLARLMKIRFNAWPNLRILAMGEELLDRRGEFTSAVADVYRAQLQRKPELKELLLRDGRVREIELAQAEPAPTPTR